MDLQASDTLAPATDELFSRDRSLGRAFLFVFDQGIVSGTTFATTVIIGRLCSKHDLGIYYLAFSAVLLARGIQYQLVSAPYMIFASRRRRAAGAYVGSSIVHQLVLTFLVMLGIVAQMALLSAGVGPRDLAVVSAVLIGTVPLVLWREFIRNLAFTHLSISTAIVVDFTVALVQVGLLALLGYLGRSTIPAVYVAMGAACVTASLAWFACDRPPVAFVKSHVLADWRHNWTFGRWALASHLIGGSTMYLIPWVVALARNEAETGMFAAATTLVGLTNPFVTGLGNFLNPKAVLAFTEGGAKALKRVLAGFAVVFIATLGLFSVSLVVYGNRWAVWLYSAKYQGIGTVAAILGFAVVANSLRMTIGTGLWAIERPGANVVADVFMLTFTLGVALACVGRFGVWGAALGILSGSVAGALAGAVILSRSLQEASDRWTVGQVSAPELCPHPDTVAEIN
jgi:O-antigen/teichoic acid export membrane protein